MNIKLIVMMNLYQARNKLRFNKLTLNLGEPRLPYTLHKNICHSAHALSEFKTIYTKCIYEITNDTGI